MELSALEVLSTELSKLSDKMDVVGDTLVRLESRIEKVESMSQETLAQAKTTNGRVTANERQILIMQTQESTKEAMTKSLRETAWKIAGTVIASLILGGAGIAWTMLKLVS